MAINKSVAFPLGAPPPQVPHVVLYRKGAMLSGWPRRSAGGAARGIIMDASERSLRLLSFYLENSDADWKYMVTLTFRVEHPNPKLAFKSWLQAMPFHDQYKYEYAWFMEFQQRGMVHFHVFLSAACLDGTFLTNGHWFETVRRRRKPVTLFRGAGHDFLVAVWCDRVADPSPEFAEFQHGGIIEVLRSRDAAGRYAAKYAEKKEQKALPADQDPLGRWWFVSEKAHPQPIGEGKLTSYPYSGCRRLIYNSESITWEPYDTAT